MWLFLLVALFLAFFVHGAIHRLYFSPLASLPGPVCASLTRLWHLFHIMKGDNNLATIALHQKHGHFVRIAPNEVSVSHPDGPSLILQSPLRKGDWYRVFSLPDYRYKNTPSILDPQAKAERTKLFSPGFSFSNLLRSESHFDTIIGNLLDWMDTHAETRRPMHLDKFFSYTALDIAGEAMFSRSFGFTAQGRDIGNHIRLGWKLNRYAAMAGYFFWLHVLLLANPLMTWTGLLSQGHVLKTLNLALKSRTENPDARFDILAHWLKMYRENRDALTFRDIEAQVIVTLSASSDTVSCALQTFVYHMIKHPSSWRRVQREIATAQLTGHCQDRVISFQDTHKLPYLRACMHEALRLFGPSPFGLSRVAPAGGITIGNTCFPDGTILSINPNVMQKSKECWGADADEWNPERWFADDISSKLKYWMIFGLGGNKCPAENLAQIEIFKIAATIVRDYSIRQVNPQNEWQCKAYITRVPHSWPVYIERQDSIR
ncbi:cytochrome P450 [Xylariomycetidae sp. FL0641]|nr:cytochrome P450 [Xylariomycetidae sp. FL0641]